ncbi:MAG: hypothetical protein QGH06_08085 [Lutibacter sp.]|nr:hypothetical protein [Lutibacter sp.]
MLPTGLRECCTQTGSQLVVTYTHLSLALTRDFFQQAQAQGAVRPEVNIEMLLLLMKEINQLAYTPEMRALYPSQEAMIVDMTNFFFYGLSGK